MVFVWILEGLSHIYIHLLKFATHPMLPTILGDSRITQQVVVKKDSVIKSWPQGVELGGLSSQM